MVSSDEFVFRFLLKTALNDGICGYIFLTISSRKGIPLENQFLVKYKYFAEYKILDIVVERSS